MPKKAKKTVDYSKKLKNRQYEAFCQYHHACKNATQAAIDAGYAVKSAKSKGSQLLTIVNIKGRVDYLASEVAVKCGVTAERVINELAKLGFSNIQDCISKDNVIKDVSKLPAHIAAAVESIQTGPKGTKIKLYDKKGALVDLGRHLNIFEKDNALGVSDDLADLMKEIGGKGDGLPIKVVI